MKIILANGTELNPLMVTGGSRYVNGANRDCLNFVFDENASMDELDGIFTEANCESIKIYGKVAVGIDANGNTVYEDSVATHNDYVIRAELKQSFESVAKENPDTQEQTVKRITVSMAQRSYMEKQMKLLEARLAKLEA